MSKLIRWIEPSTYFLAFAWLLAMFVYASYYVIPLPDPNTIVYARLEQVVFGFGFNRLSLISTPVILLWGLGTLLLLFCGYRFQRTINHFITVYWGFLVEKKWLLAVLCVLAWIPFFLLRSNMISADMRIYMQWLPDQAGRNIVHVRFDEMWESNLHSSFYILANRLWGWSVPQSFQFVATLAGPVFLYLLVIFCQKILPVKAPFLFLLLISGGYMQLFFGDMEYYTLSLTLLLGYFLAALAYIRKDVPLEVPALILGIAMTFHMETAFLLPTLFYLSIFAFQRRTWSSLVFAWITLALTISLTLLFFTHNGADLINLRDTSWGLGRGGNMLANIIIPTVATLAARLNMLTVIYPLIWFLPLLIFFKRVALNELNGFLLIGAACGIPFSLVWISTIGFYSDWNLFSMPMFPAVILTGISFLDQRRLAYRKYLYILLISFSILVSYAWIINNHLRGNL